MGDFHGEVLILVGIMVCENRVGGKKRIRGVDGIPPWYCAPWKKIPPSNPCEGEPGAVFSYMEKRC